MTAIAINYLTLKTFPVCASMLGGNKIQSRSTTLESSLPQNDPESPVKLSSAYEAIMFPHTATSTYTNTAPSGLLVSKGGCYIGLRHLIRLCTIYLFTFRSKFESPEGT